VINQTKYNHFHFQALKMFNKTSR